MLKKLKKYVLKYAQSSLGSLTKPALKGMYFARAQLSVVLPSLIYAEEGKYT